jgi:hypothetical protein
LSSCATGPAGASCSPTWTEARTASAYNPDTEIRVQHLFPVPPAAYDERSWRRWMFERVLEVERHEAAEFFVIDGERPYAPHHGPGNDPYIIFEVGSDVDRRTNFRGEVDDGGDS